MGNKNTKKNLPNIPLYIGDWERDCNVLSLEAEGAWLRIIFKMWTKGKESTIKIPPKSLQNLWRCDESKMLEIIEELKFNEIAEIQSGSVFIVFTCRRFARENHISTVRSKAAKSKQTPSKKEQITENDIDNETEVKTANSEFIGKRFFPENEKYDELNELFGKWLHACAYEVKIAVRKKYGQLAIEQLCMKLCGIPVETALAQVKQSLEKGWVNLRAIDDTGTSTKEQRKRPWE